MDQNSIQQRLARLHCDRPIDDQNLNVEWAPDFFKWWRRNTAIVAIVLPVLMVAFSLVFSLGFVVGLGFKMPEVRTPTIESRPLSPGQFDNWQKLHESRLAMYRARREEVNAERDKLRQERMGDPFWPLSRKEFEAAVEVEIEMEVERRIQLRQGKADQ